MLVETPRYPTVPPPLPHWCQWCLCWWLCEWLRCAASLFSQWCQWCPGGSSLNGVNGVWVALGDSSLIDVAHSGCLLSMH